MCVCVWVIWLYVCLVNLKFAQIKPNQFRAVQIVHFVAIRFVSGHRVTHNPRAIQIFT